jgi:hypothetical protein
MDHGSVFRRSGCRDQGTGRLLGACCPGLRSPRHGSWYFSADLPSPAGQRRRVRRGGFGTRTAAMTALAALTGPAREAMPGSRPGVAGPVAGLAGVAARVDQPRVCRARARLPGPVPGRRPSGGAVARRRPGHVHCHHPGRGRARAPGRRGYAAPHSRHVAGGAERCGPRGPDQCQPRPVARTAQGLPGRARRCGPRR